MIAAMTAHSHHAPIVLMPTAVRSLPMPHVAISHRMATVTVVLLHVVTSPLSLLVVTGLLLHHAVTSLRTVIVIAASLLAATSLPMHHVVTGLLRVATIHSRAIVVVMRALLTSTVLTAHHRIVLPTQASLPVQPVISHRVQQLQAAKPSLHVVMVQHAQALHVQVHHARQQVRVVASLLTAAAVN